MLAYENRTPDVTLAKLHRFRRTQIVNLKGHENEGSDIVWLLQRAAYPINPIGVRTHDLWI